MAGPDGRRVRTDMEQWSEIRRKVLVEGVSKRQICREYGVGWRTLEKMLGVRGAAGVSACGCRGGGRSSARLSG